MLSIPLVKLCLPFKTSWSPSLAPFLPSLAWSKLLPPSLAAWHSFTSKSTLSSRPRPCFKFLTSSLYLFPSGDVSAWALKPLVSTMFVKCGSTKSGSESSLLPSTHIPKPSCKFSLPLDNTAPSTVANAGHRSELIPQGKENMFFALFGIANKVRLVE